MHLKVQRSEMLQQHRSTELENVLRSMWVVLSCRTSHSHCPKMRFFSAALADVEAKIEYPGYLVSGQLQAFRRQSSRMDVLEQLTQRVNVFVRFFERSVTASASP